MITEETLKNLIANYCRIGLAMAKTEPDIYYYKANLLWAEQQEEREEERRE